MKNLITKLSNFECHRIGDFSLKFTGTVGNLKDITALLTEKGYDMDHKATSQIILEFIMIVADEENVRMRQAIRHVLDTLEGRFSLVITNLVKPTRAYCMTRGRALYLGLDHGMFHLSNKMDKVVAYTTQIIKLDDGVIAEMYEDGTCFFKDDSGQRLNKEYLEVLNKEYIKVERKIHNFLKEDFQKSFFPTLDLEKNLMGSICLS